MEISSSRTAGESCRPAFLARSSRQSTVSIGATGRIISGEDPPIGPPDHPGAQSQRPARQPGLPTCRMSQLKRRLAPGALRSLRRCGWGRGSYRARYNFAEQEASPVHAGSSPLTRGLMAKRRSSRRSTARDRRAAPTSSCSTSNAPPGNTGRCSPERCPPVSLAGLYFKKVHPHAAPRLQLPAPPPQLSLRSLPGSSRPAAGSIPLRLRFDELRRRPRSLIHADPHLQGPHLSDRAHPPRVSCRALVLTALLLLLSAWLATAGRAEAAWLPPVDVSRGGRERDGTAGRCRHLRGRRGGLASLQRRRLRDRGGGEGRGGCLERAAAALGGGSERGDAPACGRRRRRRGRRLVAVERPRLHRPQSATRPAGGGWGAPLDLSAPGADAKGPQVTVEGAGHFVAVWSCSPGPSTAVVQSATAVPGGAWGGQVDLSASGRNDQPQIADDCRGDAVAVWRHQEAGPTLIQSAVRPSGGVWEPGLPMSPSSGLAETPQVSLDDSGRAVAVWRRDDGAGYVIEGAQRPAGSWLPPVPLSASGNNAEAPQVAVDAVGNAVAVWSRISEIGGLSSTVIQATVQGAGGAWQSPLDVSPAEELAEGQQVGFDAVGNAVAVWTSASPQSPPSSTRRADPRAAPGPHRWQCRSPTAVPSNPSSPLMRRVTG